MWSIIFAVLAALLAVFASKLPLPRLARSFARPLFATAAAVGILSTSFVVVGSDEVGHLKRIYWGRSLEPGQIIAREGQLGPQAEILGPGFQFRLLLNVLYDVEMKEILTVPEGQYAFLTARDGAPLRPGQFLADAWPKDASRDMLNAAFFLAEGGQKGPQLSVLTPGDYRINRYLFEAKLQPVTRVPTGHVAVVKSNVQDPNATCEAIFASETGALTTPLVGRGCRGIWKDALGPGRYYLNKEAYETTEIDTRVQTWKYLGGYTQRDFNLLVQANGGIEQNAVERAIKTPSDAADAAIFVKVEGWNIPLDVRVLVQVTPAKAPFVVASVGNVKEVEDKIMTPAIRSIVRNVVGQLKVFDLQEARAKLETLVRETIIPEGLKAGVTVKEVRFGEPALPPSLRIPRLRNQLAAELIKTYREERKAQEERIATETAKAEADKQPQLVQAQIEVKIAEQQRERDRLRGEGEKLKLTEIATGQKAQVQVLGEDRVVQLAVLEKILDAAVSNPNIVKVPAVLVGGEGSLEGAAAVLGHSNLLRGIAPAENAAPRTATQ